MKKMIPSIAMLFILLALFSSCIESVNNKMIVGNWKAVSWTENGTPNVTKAENTSFVFDEKNHYSFNHAGTTKKGTYKVENNLLFTTEEGMQEIMVNITKLTADSLVFDMNNGGTPEQLTLIK
jgi:Lipocalin-like domain